MNEDVNFILRKLNDAKRGIVRIQFEPRHDPNDWKDPVNCWRRLGITYDDAIEIVEGLTIEEYIETKPCDNPHGGKLMHIFNHSHEGRELFIKISWKGDSRMITLSFHEMKEPRDL